MLVFLCITLGILQTTAQNGWPEWPTWPVWPPSEWPEWPEWVESGSVEQQASDSAQVEAAAAAVSSVTVDTGAPSINQVLSSRGDFSIFLAASSVAEYSDKFDDLSFKATVFAPTNAAFAAAFQLLGMSSTEVLENIPYALGIVEYHTVPGVAATSGQLVDGQVLNTELNNIMNLLVDTNTGVFIESVGSVAEVIEADIVAGESVIHIIDTVLLPIDAAIDREINIALKELGVEEFRTVVEATENIPSISLFQQALETIDILFILDNPLFNGTIFAPTNEAFENALQALGLVSLEDLNDDPVSLESILKYHIIFGKSWFMHLLEQDLELATVDNHPLSVDVSEFVSIQGKGSRANVLNFNIKAGNVVLYIVDTVLLPEDAAMISQSIVDEVIEGQGQVAPEQPDEGEGQVRPEEAVVAVEEEEPRFTGRQFESVADLFDSLPYLSTFSSAFDVALLKDIDFVGTIFIPSNSAFENLFNRLGVDIDYFLQQVDNVVTLVDYHIVPLERLTTDNLSSGMMARTLLSTMLSFSVDSREDIVVNAANSEGSIVEADISAGRFVVHVIDEVLLPTNPTGDSEVAIALRALNAPEFENLYQAITQIPSLSIFKSAVDVIGFTDAFQDPLFQGTVLAPTNDAWDPLFERLGISNFDELSQDFDLLQEIMLYHLIIDTKYIFQLKSGENLDTSQGTLMGVQDGMEVSIVGQASSANIMNFNIVAGQAVLYIIDNVLLPNEL